MKIALNSPELKDVAGATKLVITLEHVPAGDMFTIQYFAPDGKLLRQDKECNVDEGVLSMGVANYP